MAENILKKATGTEKLTEHNTVKKLISSQESEIDNLPQIFTKHIESEKKYVGGFIYICEKASGVRDNEESKAREVVESCQINIANWILNTSLEGFRFVERFYFSPADNKVSLLFIVSVQSEDESTVKKNSEILATEMRDVLRLNEYLRFSPVSSAFKGANVAALIPASDALSEIVISSRTYKTSEKDEISYTAYPDKLRGASSLENFMRVFMGKKNSSYVDIVVEKISPTEEESAQLKTLSDELKEELIEKQESESERKSSYLAVSDRISDLEMLERLLTIVSAAAGKALRVRYFIGGSTLEYGAGPMCFVSDYIPGASYRVVETPASFKYLTLPLVSELTGENGRQIMHVFNLDNIIPSSRFVGLFKIPLPTDNGVFGMATERLRTLKVPSTLLEERDNAMLIGSCFANDGSHELRMKPQELLRHLYVCGMTGTGKTTLLRRLCMSLVESGNGFTLIDPHGDLAADVFKYTQQLGLKEYKDDDTARVINIDFEKDVIPYCIDLFYNDGTEKQKSAILEEVVGMIFRMVDLQTMGGPMFEKYFRLIIRTLLEAHEPLTNFNKVAVDKDYRAYLLGRIKSKQGYDVYRDLDRQFDDADDYKSDGGMWPYITSKMVRFCDNEILKNFIANDKINLDFSKLMNQRAIIIVRMASGVVPETITNIIGMIINMRLNIAAKERVRVPMAQRSPYFLVIDEFQNFVSANANFTYSGREERDLTSILSEARKYGLGLILANQYISQLDRGAREAIFGNVGSKIAFRVGVEDGNYLAKTFGRGMNQGDFADLPNFYGYASMLMNNMYVDPFTIKTVV